MTEEGRTNDRHYSLVVKELLMHCTIVEQNNFYFYPPTYKSKPSKVSVAATAKNMHIAGHGVAAAGTQQHSHQLKPLVQGDVR